MANIGTLRDKEVIRGDTLHESMNFYRIVDDERVPFDLTQYDDIIMDIRDNPFESAAKFIGVSLGKGISITGDNNETLVIQLSSKETEKLSTIHNQLAPNSTNTLNTLQKPGKQEYFYFRDIRFIIADEVVTKLNGRYKVINNISNTP
jgi:hypothetical protein